MHYFLEEMLLINPFSFDSAGRHFHLLSYWDCRSQKAKDFELSTLFRSGSPVQNKLLRLGNTVTDPTTSTGDLKNQDFSFFIGTCFSGFGSASNHRDGSDITIGIVSEIKIAPCQLLPKQVETVPAGISFAH